MNSSQYRAASRCGNERHTTNSNLPVAVKRIRPIERPAVEQPVNEHQPVALERPEQPPIVRVKQRVVIRKRLARLREDFQAVSRLKEHIEMDRIELEQQLGKKRHH